MDNFQWTDELVFEFITFYTEYIQAPKVFWASEIAEEFKKSKLRKPLFTTEDGVDIYEGQKVIGVDKSIVYEFTTATDGINTSVGKFFSTREKADEYILVNKPLFSINEILDFDQEINGNGIAVALGQKLMEKANKKINGL